MQICELMVLVGKTYPSLKYQFLYLLSEDVDVDQNCFLSTEGTYEIMFANVSKQQGWN